MKLLILLVRAYQLIISPVLHALTGPMSGCRYQPTCSQYAIDAMRVHGILKGLWLGTKRIFRCAPWGHQGWDPVPGWETWVAAHPEHAHTRKADEPGGCIPQVSEDKNPCQKP